MLWGFPQCTFENTSSKKKQLDRLFLAILFQLPADFPVSPVRLLLLGGEVARALAHPPSHLIFHSAPTVWQFCAALSTFRGVTSHGHTHMHTTFNRDALKCEIVCWCDTMIDYFANLLKLK